MAGGGGTEIARAFVTIIPKSDGKFGSEIDKSLGELGKTGDEQGTKAGKAFATKFASFGGKAGQMAGKALAVGMGAATAGLISFGKSTIEVGMQFDASMAQVAATMGKDKRADQTFVGFAAETNDVLAHARGKLEKKNLDMIVANDVTAPGAGFDVNTNIVTLITKADMVSLPLMSKDDVADHILDGLLGLRK